MKKLFAVVVSCFFLIVATLVLTQTSVLESVLSAIFGETQNSQDNFEVNWYFTMLNDKEKEIYLKIATAIDNCDSDVVVVSDSTLSVNAASRAYEAFLLDNPDCFYLNSEYKVSEMKVLNVTKIEIKLEYTSNKMDISEKIEELNKEVDSIISKLINADMSDFEKEVALHDYLVENVRYYNYTEIKDIPAIKHTAYGALIEKEAVCDGLSKAYSLLLNECDINNIVVTGETGERHAWNKVKLEDDWYNTDVTSDICGEERVLSHVYFNLTDKELSNTHVFDLTFTTPECRSKKYNYYEYNDFKVTNQDFFSDKIKKVIENSNGKVLEFRVDSNIEVKSVIQELYNQNFNNYKTNNIREVKYFYMRDVIVIPN